MPRNKLDIRAFSAGLFTNGDPVDIPPGASEYHQDIDPNAPEGILRGRPEDLNLASKWTATDPPSGMDAAAMIQRGDGKVTLVTTGGEQASPGFSPIGGTPSPSHIHYYEDFYAIGGPTMEQYRNVSSVPYPDIIKDRESLRVLCGRNAANPPMYVGYPQHNQFSVKPSDKLIIEKAELTGPTTIGKAFRALVDGTYVYFFIYNDSTVWRVTRADGTAVSLAVGYVEQAKAMCWDYSGGATPTAILVFDQHDALGRIRRIPLTAFGDPTVLPTTMNFNTYSITQSERDLGFQWTDMACTAGYIYLAGYLWGASADRPSAEPWRVPYAFGATLQTLTNIAPFIEFGNPSIVSGAELPPGQFFYYVQPIGGGNWEWQVVNRKNEARGMYFPLAVADITQNLVWYRTTPESYQGEGRQWWFSTDAENVVQLADPNIFVLLRPTSTKGEGAKIAAGDSLAAASSIRGGYCYQQRTTGGSDGSGFYFVGTSTYLPPGGAYEYNGYMEFTYANLLLLAATSSRYVAFEPQALYNHGTRTPSHRSLLLSGINKIAEAYAGPQPTGVMISSPTDGAGVMKTFPMKVSNPTEQQVKAADLISMTVTEGSPGGLFKVANRYYFRMALQYDGYQMSTMGAQYSVHPSVDNVGVNVSISFPVKWFPKRLSGIYVFMSTSISTMAEPSELFSLVRFIPFDSTWSSSGTLTMSYNFSLTDPEEIEQTYEAMTGINEALGSNFVHYEVGCLAGGFLFAGRCWHPMLDDASQYIFRSRPGRPDMFDWSKDFIVLPEIPVAMAEYDGGLWVFSRTTAYRIDPVNFVVTDTIPNIGALGSKSVKATRQGLVVCGNTDIWILQSKEWKNASMTIRGTKEGAWGTMAHNDFPPIVTETDLYGVQIIADSHDARYIYVLSQNGAWWHWKLEQGINDGPAAAFEGVYGENYYTNSTSTYQIAGDPVTRKWFSWTSLKHPGGSPGLRKKLYFVRWTPGTFNGMRIQYRTSEWDWQDLSLTGETDMTKIFGTWFQTRIVPVSFDDDPGVTTREVQTITFIYRELEGLR